MIRNAIRSLLKRYGYDIIKTGNYHGLKGKGRTVEVQVWKYKIDMPDNNPLVNVYKFHPDFNFHFSKLVMAIVQKYPDMTVVDVGANVGDTIAIIKSTANVRIIGIEGDDISYNYLEKNVKQFDKVQINKAFLGDITKEIKAEVSKAGWNTTIVPKHDSTNVLEIKTLNFVLSETKFNNVTVKLLKIDTEGFDTIILRGAYEVIEKNYPVLFFEYNLDNMQKINENGLSTIFSFKQLGYDKVVFFDCMGAVLLCTSLQNVTDILSLHNYATNEKNLLGYYDIAIFHALDGEIAEHFFPNRGEYLQ